jgi:hypothetical protein
MKLRIVLPILYLILVVFFVVGPPSEAGHVTHTLSVNKVQDWLKRSVRTPKEAVLKERLRVFMSA